MVAPDATIVTDALPAYPGVAADHEHLTVTHSAGEYVAHDAGGPGLHAHTNTAESVHGLIRRAVIGGWHWISQKRLDRYLDELAWRHNRRGQGHLSRIADASAAGGAPLSFREFTSSETAWVYLRIPRHWLQLVPG